MPNRQSPIRAAAVPMLAAALSALGAGCVASEKAAYRRHLTTIIDSGRANNADVSIAFGLDEHRTAPLASRSND